MARSWVYGCATVGNVSGYVVTFVREKRLRWEFFFFQAEDGIRDTSVTGVQTCALPISAPPAPGIASASVPAPPAPPRAPDAAGTGSAASPPVAPSPPRDAAGAGAALSGATGAPLATTGSAALGDGGASTAGAGPATEGGGAAGGAAATAGAGAGAGVVAGVEASTDRAGGAVRFTEARRVGAGGAAPRLAGAEPARAESVSDSSRRMSTKSARSPGSRASHSPPPSAAACTASESGSQRAGRITDLALPGGGPPGGIHAAPGATTRAPRASGPRRSPAPDGPRSPPPSPRR